MGERIESERTKFCQVILLYRRVSSYFISVLSLVYTIHLLIKWRKKNFIDLSIAVLQSHIKCYKSFTNRSNKIQMISRLFAFTLFLSFQIQYIDLSLLRGKYFGKQSIRFWIEYSITKLYLFDSSISETYVYLNVCLAFQFFIQ